MADERASWLYDSIVGYLKSPEWSVPVMEFIDANCIVFDTEDENKFEFTTVHQKFCEMVNNLLEGFLADMGISPEEFVEVCQSPQASALNEFVFNQILAVDDFVSFKKMMVKRTLELNVQAMSMMKLEAQPAAPEAAVAAAAPAAEAAAADGPAPEDIAADDADLAEAIRLSKETFNQGNSAHVDEDELLKQALAMSLTDSDVQAARVDQEEAELAHAVAMSQAMEEQRLKGLLEEEERQAQAAIEASRLEVEAVARAEEMAQQVVEREAVQRQAEADAAERAAAEAALAVAREQQQQAAEEQAAAHRAFEAAEARAAAAKEAKAKMERESAAKRAAMPSLPAGGKLAPLGGLAPMSESQRTAAAEKTMALINKPPAAAPAAAKMELSAAELEARKAHLLAQRQKIIEKNTAMRQKQVAEAAQLRQAEQKAAPAPPPAPSPAPSTGPRVIEVKPKVQTTTQQRLTQALASQMRRDLLSGHQ